MRVITGMDPHKRSATIEVIDQQARVLATGTYDTDNDGYGRMLCAGRAFPERVWAIEGCNGIGKHLAHRLVHDGETVAFVGLRTPNLVTIAIDPDLQVLGMLVDRRDELGRAKTQTAPVATGNAARRSETLPSALQARAAIATIRPRDIVGKTRRRLVVELIGELEGVDNKIRSIDKDLTAPRRLPRINPAGAVRHRPVGATRLLADVGDVTRFATRDRFASWNSTARLDASSGQQLRHRLSRAGNRRINRTLHIMAAVQLRNPTEGRAYFKARKAADKTSMEAMRALKRRLSNVAYQ